jgi:hypothetical protein
MLNITKEFLTLDRLTTAICNIIRSSAPVSKMSEQERSDSRLCKHCGGLRRSHGVYGTIHHVPDLDKPLDGYQLATAFCQSFEPEEM